MKPIYQLTNRDKASILHQLFPEEISTLVSFIEDMCATVKEQEVSLTANWDNPLLSVGQWLKLAEEVEQNINRFRKGILSQHRKFSDLLFGGYTALFSIHCLQVYHKTTLPDNYKLRLALDLLFMPLAKDLKP